MNYRILPPLFLATLLCVMTANVFLVLQGPEPFNEIRLLVSDGFSWRSGDLGIGPSPAKGLLRVALNPLFFAALAVAGAVISLLFVRQTGRLGRGNSLRGGRQKETRVIAPLQGAAIACPTAPPLRGKLARRLGLLLGLFACGAIGWAHYKVPTLLQHGPVREGRALAAALAEGVAPHVVGNDRARARAVLLKQASRHDLAYLLIADNQENLWTYTVKRAELAPVMAQVRLDDAGQRVVNFNGTSVYDLRAPIREGAAGMVHIGMRQDRLAEDLQRILWTIDIAVLTALSLIYGVGHFLVARISQPLERLSLEAWKVSEGCLNRPLNTGIPGVPGALARSLENLRVELSASLKRLSDQEKHRL